MSSPHVTRYIMSGWSLSSICPFSFIMTFNNQKKKNNKSRQQLKKNNIFHIWTVVELWSRNIFYPLFFYFLLFSSCGGQSVFCLSPFQKKNQPLQTRKEASWLAETSILHCESNNIACTLSSCPARSPRWLESSTLNLVFFFLKFFIFWVLRNDDQKETKVKKVNHILICNFYI